MRMQKKPEILYEDEALLVCVKPAGLPVQTAKTRQTDLVSLLKNERARRGEEPYIGIVHRLDQPVKGVMVFAKTKQAAADLSAQVSAHRMKKEYLAVVCHRGESSDTVTSVTGIGKDTGRAKSEDCWWELHDYLRKDARSNVSSVVPKGTPGAKEAWLSYKYLSHSEKTGRSLVRIRLGSGRHHQIRVQFAHADMPLYGDTKYGDPLPDGVRQPVALESCMIGFCHPVSRKWMEFESDVSTCLMDMVENS